MFPAVPLRDNLKYQGVSWVTIALVAINVLAYALEQTWDSSGQLYTLMTKWLPVRETVVESLASGYPAPVLHAIGSLFAGLFLHKTFVHILVNMCYLITFAPGLEARMGHLRFALFYVTSGLLAVGAFLFTDIPGTNPLLGASGAISGVLGAYIIYFPKARVDCFVAPCTISTTLAVFFLVDYSLLQWVCIWAELRNGPGAAGNVGYWAHIGGLIFGMLIGALMAMSDVGWTRGRYLVFYAFVAMICAAGLAAEHAGLVGFKVPFFVREGVIALPVVGVYLLLFPHSRRKWTEVLLGPLSAIAVVCLLGGCLFLLWGASEHSDRISQVLRMGVAGLTVTVVCLALAIAARRFPPTKKPRVAVPFVKENERLLAEIVIDGIVGFFGAIQTKVITASDFLTALAVATLRGACSQLIQICKRRGVSGVN